MLCKKEKDFEIQKPLMHILSVDLPLCIVLYRSTKRNAHSLSKLAKCRIKLFLNEDIQNRKKRTSNLVQHSSQIRFEIMIL